MNGFLLGNVLKKNRSASLPEKSPSVKGGLAVASLRNLPIAKGKVNGWYDFTDVNQYTVLGNSDTTIQEYADKSICRNDVVNLDLTVQPLIIANAINGKNVARFSSSSIARHLTLKSGLKQPFNFCHQGNRSIIVVYKPLSDLAQVATRRIVGTNIGATVTTGFLVGYRGSTSSTRFINYRGATGTYIEEEVVIEPLKFSYLIDTIDKSTTQKGVRVNGGAFTYSSFSFIFNMTESTEVFMIGDATSTDIGFDIAEIIICNDVLTSTEVANLDIYMNLKYGTFPIA